MPEREYGDLDIVAGQLPMVGRPGGARKVVLGAARNPKRSFLWRLMWTIGALICTISILLSYFLLGQQEHTTVFVWAGFQLLWLGMRILVYHVADTPDLAGHRMLVAQPLATLPADMKQRVRDLTFALAKCQTFIHPRSQLAYEDDVFSSDLLKVLLVVSPNYYPLPNDHLPSIRVNVKAVFGDTSLSSAVWMSGINIAPMELYDSCIVVFSIASSTTSNTTPRTIAVPAARVLCGLPIPKLPVDIEDKTPTFIPRGAPNSGQGLIWWYWVPCSSGLWLQIKSEDLTILGQRQVDVVNDTQVSARLNAGDMNVSLSRVDEVKEVVALSRKARQSLLELLD